jgi:hypothetical protein
MSSAPATSLDRPFALSDGELELKYIILVWEYLHHEFGVIQGGSLSGLEHDRQTLLAWIYLVLNRPND